MLLNFIRQATRERFCLKWAVFGLYFFLAAFFWVSGPAPLRNIFYIFLLLPLLMVLPWRKWRSEEYGGQYTIAALAFAAYCVFSSLWGNPADFSVYLKQWFFLALWLCGVAWIFYQHPINMQRIYLTLISTGVICALATLCYFYIYKNNPLLVRLSGIGLLENPTIVAQTYGVVTLLAYIKALQVKNWKISLVFLASALICVLPLLMSQSRGAAMGLIVVASAALFIVRPAASIWLPQLCFAIVAAILFIVFTDIDAILQNRGLSFSFRDIIWHEILTRVIENPFFGIGMEHDARIIIPDVDVFHHSHNSWIDIVYYTGLVGLGLACWHLSLLLSCYSRNPAILPVYLWLIYGCLCLFTNGSNLLTAPGAQWWMYWVPACLLAALVKSGHHAE